MMRLKTTNKKQSLIYLCLLIALFFIGSEAYSSPINIKWGEMFSNISSGNFTITSMLAKLNNTWGAIFELTVVIAKIAALAFFVISLHKAVLISRDKAELKTFIMYLLAAGCLWSLGDIANGISQQMGIGNVLSDNFASSGIDTSSQNSMFMSSQLGQAVSSAGGHGVAAFESIIALIHVIGLISIVRGFFLMKSLGDPRQQNASTGKVILHLFAGAMLMNIVTVAQTFMNTVV